MTRRVVLKTYVKKQASRQKTKCCGVGGQIAETRVHVGSAVASSADDAQRRAEGLNGTSTI